MGSFPDPAAILAAHPRAVLISGREDVVAVVAADILDAVRAKAGPGLRVSAVTIGEEGIAGVAPLLAPELFPAARFFTIRGAARLKAGDAPAVEGLLRGAGERDYLLFVADTPRGPFQKKEGHSFERSVPAGLAVVTIPAPSGREFTDWIGHLCRARRVDASRDLLRYIGEATDEDLSLAALEVEKLSLAFGQRKVDLAEAMPLIDHVPHQDVFTLLDAIVAGDRGRVLALVAELTAAGHHPIYLASMVAFQLRTLLTIRYAIDHGSSSKDAVRVLRRPPAVAHALAAAAERLSYAGMVTAFDRLVRADFAMKSSPHPPELILEDTLFSLFSPEAVGYSYAATLDEGEAI